MARIPAEPKGAADTGPTGLATIAAGEARRCAPVFASWRDRFAEAYVREMIEFVAAMDGAPVRVGARCLPLTSASSHPRIVEAYIKASLSGHFPIQESRVY